MDYYTSNFGGAYHDQFYTMANVTAAYKTYISHVLNRNNTLTGVQYKVNVDSLQSRRGIRSYE
jgi:mannan endo-1,4-beta-mannosidase